MGARWISWKSETGGGEEFSKEKEDEQAGWWYGRSVEELNALEGQSDFSPKKRGGGSSSIEHFRAWQSGNRHGAKFTSKSA